MYQQTKDDSLLVCSVESDADLYVRDLNDRADRVKHLEFHIENDDYFAVLATIFNIAVKDKNIDLKTVFEKLIEDMEYLQTNYKIVKK